MRTVKQVSESSGVSVRALHHYDHIGLLTPRTGDNGYRYYSEADLLRLQHILFYRELGVPLADIARMLDDPAFDARAVLVDLKRRVDGETHRLRQLSLTIERTLALVEAGQPVDDHGLFAGLSAEKQAAWEADLVARWGPEVRPLIDESRQRLAQLSTAQLSDLRAEVDDIHARLVELIEAGGSATSTAAQTLVARHFAWVCRSWKPDATAYAELGRLYVEHADFRRTYDDLHPRLAEFLSLAMATYARRCLAAGAA